jgi:hypothetical protein
MKAFFFLVIFSASISAQDRAINLRGYEIELGMSMIQTWEILKKEFNVIEDKPGNFYVADKHNTPVGIIFFEGEKAVKIIKDWGTADKTNVGQVFKTLWNIFRQYEKELSAVEILPLETFTQKGSKYNLQFNLTKNRRIEVAIQHTVTVIEVLAEDGY